MDAFRAIKEAIPMREAVVQYGFEPDRVGRISVSYTHLTLPTNSLV